MGLLTNFFSKIKTRVYYGMGTQSTPYTKEIYEQELVRAVIDCIATHTAKANAMHIIVDDQDRIKSIERKSMYVRLLNQRPNPLMVGYDLKYKLATAFQEKTTAMCYVHWKGAEPDMMVPIQYEGATIYPVVGGGYALEFMDYWGESVSVRLEQVVMLRKFYNKSEVYGDGNDPIYNTLTVMKAMDESTEEVATVSNKIRGILTQKKSMLAKEDVDKSTDSFIERYKAAATKGGIIGVDAMEDYKPLQLDTWAANAAQMREIKANVFYYWRISDAILKSDYTDNQWKAFYEAVIEPFLILMGQAFTAVCFTEREYEAGNRIIFSTNMMANMSAGTVKDIIANTREIGMFTPNEYREMLGYSPIEGGDDIQVSLNYVKRKDQSKYQTGEEQE